jgi:CRISPR system Cascade subunit CasE
MIYLSKIELDILDRTNQSLLSDVYRLHRSVMGGFKAYTPEELGRVLFRLEPERSERFAVLLVQSLQEPDWSHLPAHSVNVQTKRYVPKFHEGELLTFRLRANPVVTRNKKRYGLIREPDQRQWLLRKKIGADWLIQNVIDEGRVIGKREGKSLEFKSVRYEGYLQVNDPDQLIQSCLEGIGPAKGFGFGMLSLAKMR